MLFFKVGIKTVKICIIHFRTTARHIYLKNSVTDVVRKEIKGNNKILLKPEKTKTERKKPIQKNKNTINIK